MTPEEINQRVHEIDALLKAHHFPEVIRQGEVLLPFCPESVPLLRILGYAYLGVKDYPNARRHLETALRYDTNQSRALCSVAKVLLQEGRYETVDLLFREAYYKHGLNSIEAFEDWYACELKLKQLEAKAEKFEDNKLVRNPEEILIKALNVCDLHESFTLAWIERLITHNVFNSDIEKKMREYLNNFPHRKEVWKLLIHTLASKGIINKVEKELDNYRKTIGHDTTWIDLLRYSAQFGYSSV